MLDAGVADCYFLDDIHVPFRANPWLRQWLPAWPCEGFLLGYRPSRRPLLAWLQPDDYWHLPPQDPQGHWTRAFDIVTVPTRAAGIEHLRHAGLAHAATTAWIGPAAADVPAQVALNPAPLLAWLDWDRTTKTDWELGCHRRASDAAAAGHLAARRAFEAGSDERAIYLAYLQACGQLPQELPYEAIVALDRHASVLHYQYKDARAPSPSLTLLIDAGAADHGYAADVTRTWCSSAAPSAFGDLIEAMDALQQDIVAAIRVGMAYPALHEHFHAQLARLLLDCGLVRGGSIEAVIQTGVSRRFCPHGLGHHLGLMTHDAGGLLASREGEPSPPPPADPALRNTRRIETGQVFTIEPGLYFIDSLLADLPRREGAGGPWIDPTLLSALHPCGGIRIEDNVAVHGDHVENLTRNAFTAAA